MSIYLCGNTGIANRGCEAIIRSTVKLLGQKSGDIYLATSAQDMDLPLVNDLGINIIPYNPFPSKFHRYYAKVMRHLHSVDGMFLQAGLFSHLSKTDLCLNIGGDTYCYGRPNRSIELNQYTSREKINNVLWCCSVEKSVMKGEILNDLKKYKYIFAREKITYKNLLKSGIEENRLIKCCDPAFFLDKSPVDLPEGFLEGNTLGINVSEITVSENQEAIPCFIKFIRHILEKTNMAVCLIPHVYNIKKNISDWPVLQQIYGEFFDEKRVCIVDKEYNCEQLKYIISKCRFVIASRTHVSIAAYSSEIPTLVLGYSVKSKGIAADLFGTDEHFVLTNKCLTTQSLNDDFEYIYNHEQNIRQRLHDYLPEYRKQLLDGIEILNSLIIKTDKICDHRLCTGCGACQMSCPKNCISMQPDEQGFCYPVIDSSRCISCGKCRRICPVENRYKDDGQKPRCFVAINKDNQIRISSSSGGIFYEVAKHIIDDSGGVFGVICDENQNVILDFCDSVKDLSRMQGSKYVQADVKSVYKKAEEILKTGRKVLFSGTSCQIGGLYAYLGKDYENLVTLEPICHGVGSAKAWQQYKKFLEKSYDSKIVNVSFRSKVNGWRTFSLKVIFENGKVLTEKVTDNIFLKAFISNLILRPSCFECAYKQVHRQADITLADFWGIDVWNPKINDNKGASAVFLHSAKAEKIFDEIKNHFDAYDISFEDAIVNNFAYLHSCLPNALRRIFEKRWRKASFCIAAKPFFNKSKISEFYRKGKLITNWRWK